MPCARENSVHPKMRKNPVVPTHFAPHLFLLGVASFQGNFPSSQAPAGTSQLLSKFWPGCLRPNPSATEIRVGSSVCVCVEFLKRRKTCTFNAGAMGFAWQTQCNEAMPWKGKHDLTSHVYLQYHVHGDLC